MNLAGNRLALVAGFLAGFLALASAPVPASAAVSPPVPASAAASPARWLAERFLPVLVVEPQARECGSGEPYRPASVDILLGRQGVVLRDAARRVVKRAPTAADLFDRPAGDYLDLPGNPLTPNCTYERDFRRWDSGRRPLVYAHLATDPEHPGRLAVQYWFFYTFNDFTNKHEGDWEMAQVDFAASTPAQALSTEPYQVDLAQHGGGERSAWTDLEVHKDGTRPVLYVATGSHATYFGRALYLGRSAHEGFGCDNTSRDTEALRPETEVLYGVPHDATSPYAWLAFKGLWGQRLGGINDGPTGPASKDQWSHPIEWANGLRDSSVTVPGTKTLGPTVSNFFCDAVTQTSIALNWGLVHPAPFLALAVFTLLGCLATAWRTRWRPPDAYPVRVPRRGGQILRAAVRLYTHDLPTFLALGAVFVPLSVLTAAVQWVLFHLTGLGSFVALDGKRGAVTTLFAVLIGDVGAAFASVLATAAVVIVLREIAEGRRPAPPKAVRVTLERLRALAGATLIQYVAVLLLTLTVVGIPLAIYLFIRWSLFVQACMLDERPGRDSLARSSDLVRGRWWRTFGFTALVDVLALLSGLLMGIALLLLTARTLNFIDIASSLVYALTVPLAAIALTLYYFDLEASPQASA